jgi:hypothetical protein
VAFGYDGGSVASLAGFDLTLPTPTAFGARVATVDVLGDAGEDLVAGAGPDPAADSRVRSYDYTGGALSLLPVTFAPFAPGYGVNVAGGRLAW